MYDLIYISQMVRCKRSGLTLCLGRSVGENAVTSARLAYELGRGDKHGKVLYINTFQGTWKLNNTLATAVGKWFNENTQSLINIQCSTLGDLANDVQEIISMATQKFEPVRTIVINSWEFGAHCSRSREKLLYMLQNLITTYGISIIVFAEQLDRSRALIPGKIMRGGFGKLIAAVDRVYNIGKFEMENGKMKDDPTEFEEQPNGMILPKDFKISSMEKGRIQFVSRKEEVMPVPGLREKEEAEPEIAEAKNDENIEAESVVKEAYILPATGGDLPDINLGGVHNEFIEFEEVTGDVGGIGNEVMRNRTL